MEKYINMSIALNDDGCFWEESQIGVGTTMIILGCLVDRVLAEGYGNFESLL